MESSIRNKIRRIVDEHVLRGNEVQELLIQANSKNDNT